MRPVGLANALLSSQGFLLLDRFGMKFYLTDSRYSYRSNWASCTSEAIFTTELHSRVRICRSERFRPKRLSARRNPVRSSSLSPSFPPRAALAHDLVTIRPNEILRNFETIFRDRVICLINWNALRRPWRLPEILISGYLANNLASH